MTTSPTSPTARSCKTCVFIDDSGSTDGVKAYHDRVLSILKNYASNDSDARYFLWGSDCVEVSFQGAMVNATFKKGRGGGTYPHKIVSKIKSDEITMEKIVVITDGRIGQGDAVTCAQDCSNQTNWTKAEIHIVTSGSMDSTVVAGFIQDVPHIIYGNDMTQTIGECSLSIQSCVESINSISTMDDFNAKLPEVRSWLVASSITKDVPIFVHDAIVKMKARLIKALQQEQEQQRQREHTEEVSEETTTMTLDQRMTRGILEMNELEQIMHDYYSADAGENEGCVVAKPQDLISKVDELLSLCRKSGNFTLDHLRNARHNRSEKKTELVEVDDIPDVVEHTWDDSILMQDTKCLLVPFKKQITVSTGDGLTRTFQQINIYDGGFMTLIPESMHEEVRRNPLVLLGNPKILNDLRSFVLLPLSREVVQGVLHVSQNDSTEFLHPMTRNEMMREFFVLGTSDDHARANMSFIAKFMFGGQKMWGPYASWFAVFYAIFSEINFLDQSFKESLDESFKEVAITSNRLVYIGLNGTGQRPLVKTNLINALMYCVHSTKVFGNSATHSYNVSNGPMTKFDAMREFHYLSKWFGKFIQVCVPDFPFGEYGPKLTRIHNVARYHRRILNAKKHTKKIAANKIRSIIGDFFKSKTFGTGEDQLVYLFDEHTTQSPSPSSYLEFGTYRENEECKNVFEERFKALEIALDPKNNMLSFGAMDLDYRDMTPSFKMPGKNYSTYQNCIKDICDISPKTLRPYCDPKNDNSSWTDIVRKLYSVQDVYKGVVSLNKAILTIVARQQGKLLHPSENESDFVDVLEMITRKHGPILPTHNLEIMSTIIDQMNAVCQAQKYTSEEITKIIGRGVSRVERMKMEKE